jgi:hypothetical protein
VATREKPVAIGEMPVATEEKPVATGEMPVATEERSVAIGGRPVATEEMPVATEVRSKTREMPMPMEPRYVIRAASRAASSLI